MSNPVDSIRKEILLKLETDMGYNVEPEGQTYIDWQSFPVAFLDIVDEKETNESKNGWFYNDLNFNLVVIIRDDSRNIRIEQISQACHDLKGFISKNFQWNCLAFETNYITSQFFPTTDSDDVGSLLFNFTVQYRERRTK